MLTWLRGLFYSRSKAELDLKSDIQGLRLDLDRREEEIRQLKDELFRLRTREDQKARGVLEARLEALMEELASPAAQILTQIHLHEKEGRTLEPRDVIATSGRLVRILMDNGLEAISEPGSREQFDPARHEPLGQETISAGDPVLVRFAGFAYNGKVIRRAGVQRVG